MINFEIYEKAENFGRQRCNFFQVQGFKQYVELYTKNTADESGEPLKMCYEQAGPRWEVALTVSDKGFQQVSFVNSIATTKVGFQTNIFIKHERLEFKFRADDTWITWPIKLSRN